MSDTVTGTPAAPSLRERKRTATRAVIERAAITLALEHGYDEVTVEMICDASMVSPRTFFNYFGTKEGVILGSGPPMPNDEDARRFVAGTGNVLGELVTTISAALVDQEPDTDLLRSRRTVLQRTPELANKEMARLIELEGQLTKLVLQRFHAHGRTAETTADLEDEARMVVALAAGALHFAMKKWAAGDSQTAPRELVQETVRLISRITGHDGLP